MSAVLVVNAIATAFLAGVIWFVQVVHYPLFAAVPDDAAVAYAAEHQRRTGWVVSGPMVVEAATAVLLVADPPAGVGRALPVAGLLLVALLWAATWLLSVPCHRRLAAGPDPGAVRRLVATNWARTAGWTARAVLVAVMLLRAG